MEIRQAEIKLDLGLLDNLKEISSEMTATLQALLGAAVEQAITAQSREWFLEFPAQVSLCAARIHFYRSMEMELDNRAKGDLEAVSRLRQVQQAHVSDGMQMADAHLGYV